MYQALYRKWRPKVFEDVLGQSHITDTLKNQIVSHKLSHAYLFSGSRGTGKTSTAKILSRAVNCENPVNGNPCNECHACQTALNGSAVDIIEIDAASNNRVDDVRIIRDEVVYTPADLKYKVYIIDEAHMLTNQAFNALLKTLEEPPAHVIFIFATTEPHKFPATILSRCQRFDFKRITPFDTEKRIRQITAQDGYSITDEALGLLARIADGSMRDALSVLDQCLSSGVTSIDFEHVAKITGTSDPNFIYEFSQHVIDGDLKASFTDIKSAYENGRDMERILEDLIAHFRSVLITKTLDCKDSALEILMATKTAFTVYVRQANVLSVQRLLRYLDTLSEAISSGKYLHNPRLCVEVAVTAMLNRPGDDLAGLVERMQELELELARLKAGGVTVYKETVPVMVPSESFVSKVEEPSEEEEIPMAEQTEEFYAQDIVSSEQDVSYYEDFVPDYPTEDIPVSDESLNQPIPSEEEAVETTPSEFSEDVRAESVSDQSGAITAVWATVLETAKQKADFGFSRIMADSKLVESEDNVELFFQNEAFLNIAKMNQYDTLIANAVAQITGKNIRIKFRAETKSTDKEDSFHQLLSRLDGIQGKVTFK
ncbi:MAG: DNA polymerase III subunit gamma/tau [Clostridia bacterium]|nr:DNA polymerase III subunit gamma/tau [Clostridia bacterium]